MRALLGYGLPLFVLATLVACKADWDGKAGFSNCKPAIAAYPKAAAPTCGQMNMCANEATLTATESTKLLSMMAAAGCSMP